MKLFAYFVLWFIVYVGMHVQFLVTLGYLTHPPPLPPCFCFLFASKNGMVNTQVSFLPPPPPPPPPVSHTLFVSPSWNTGLTLKDWVQLFAEMPVI